MSNNPLAQDITAQLKQEELSNAAAFLHGSSPYQENLAEAARVRGEVEPFERAIGSMSAAEELQAGAVDAKMREQLQTHQNIEAATTEGHKAAAKIAEAGDAGDSAVANKILLPSPPRPPTVVESADAATDDLDGVDYLGADNPIREIESAADQVKAQFQKADTEKEQEAAQTSLESYIEKFRSAMPDYEGKTESEKGMDIVKMGMAIAAGESPNAITNISKGVMATIDNFTSDDKERRAYKRQIGLSAAKYALDSVARDEAKADALAKELRGDKLFTVMKDSSIDGRKYDAGSLYRMSVGDMRDGKLAELSGVLTTDDDDAGFFHHH